MNRRVILSLAATLTFFVPLSAKALTVPVDEDVMTSGFFQGTDRVRGYSGDNRNVHRVSTDVPFGVGGAETVYLTFDPNAFSGLTTPIEKAVLKIESTPGGFGADGDPNSPFTASAHAVTTDPLAAIIDDTNPGGSVSWLDFFNNNILAADPNSLTIIDSFGQVEFNVTNVVNDWISGSNTVFALALTGKNDTSGSDILHGFLNNTENPGSTFLSITVPEPTSSALFLVAAIAGLSRRRRNS